MANKKLFSSAPGGLLPATDTRNAHGAPAYRLTPEQALAQYAVTGCLNDTFYASAPEQLAAVLGLCAQVSPEFVAKAAIHARERGFMKDLPALLCAVLAVRAPDLLPPVFERVVDSPRMLRNVVQIIRSGVTGRKSLGSRPKRLVLRWLEQHDEDALFRAAVGESPSLADIVRMVHPRPASPMRQAFYGYLLGQPHNAAVLPPSVRAYEAFRTAPAEARPAVPEVAFQYLTSLELSRREWAAIARLVSWQTLRQNLNTFLRHGVFDDPEAVRVAAARLRDPREVRRARVFPYQLLCAYRNAGNGLPHELREALQEALDAALGNVPGSVGKVYVFPDVSGSMRSPLTGRRKGATSTVQCVDIAALVAAALLRRNPGTEVLPFTEAVVPCALNPRDSVLTNAARLARLPAGGTNCSAPLRHLNARGAVGDLVIYVSDNQSWVDTVVTTGLPTATMREWADFKRRSPRAQMVCVDVQPGADAQARPGADVLHVAGFSDQVFDLIAAVSRGGVEPDWWVRQIEAVQVHTAGAA